MAFDTWQKGTKVPCPCHIVADRTLLPITLMLFFEKVFASLESVFDSVGSWLKQPHVLRLGKCTAVTLLASGVLAFVVELIVRGSFRETWMFFGSTWRPWWTTVLLLGLLLAGLDGLLGRVHQSVAIVAPVLLMVAWVCRQKITYLGDPLYPSDFLYVRQICELWPLLVKERPVLVSASLVAIVAMIAVIVWLGAVSRQRFRVLPWRWRLIRILLALPALMIVVAELMDSSRYSTVRDRLRVAPMMWDQKENYSHNGFPLAFTLNLPMAQLKTPAGYSKEAINKIIDRVSVTEEDDDKPRGFWAWLGFGRGKRKEHPDIIMVMNESFWDASRLPGVSFKPDPIPTVRAAQSGHVFSPEFGGMTANVEFEALTGFSNAFLPYGSIPYQQYVRGPLPSLANALRRRGYATCAVHPFREWFWNRKAVYEAFGFEEFLSEERLSGQALEKRGPLASDKALTEEIIRQVEQRGKQKTPVFLFAVTLQNHGPYESLRYEKVSIQVSAGEKEKSPSYSGLDEETWAAISSYAEGTADGDQGLARLIKWAKGRKRETVLVFFGDHLPPLGDVYVDTGFMPGRVAARSGPPEVMKAQHETPLVVWSNRGGAKKNIGTISPALLPFHVLQTARISHPYYTGFLGEVQRHYRVVDRNLRIKPDGTSISGALSGAPAGDGLEHPEGDILLREYRNIQYDMMFGNRHALPLFQSAP